MEGGRTHAQNTEVKSKGEVGLLRGSRESLNSKGVARLEIRYP